MCVTIACLVTRVDFCFKGLVWKATNARMRSHEYEAKAEPHKTGCTGMTAVQSFPDMIREYMDKFNFDFHKY